LTAKHCGCYQIVKTTCYHKSKTAPAVLRVKLGALLCQDWNAGFCITDKPSGVNFAMLQLAMLVEAEI